MSVAFGTPVEASPAIVFSSRFLMPVLPIESRTDAGHTDAVDLHRPDPEAYGRVTNPYRYRVVAEEAKALISRLAEAYDVVRSVSAAEVDFPECKGSGRDTIRLVPSQGVPLTFALTDLPGVFVGFGSWGQETFPDCGCDACDEQPAEVVRRMTELVETAIGGGYEEELTKRVLRRSFVGQWGRSARETRLKRGEWQHHGQLGTHRWPQWPRRESLQRPLGP
jgi:hypothetical protein